MILTKKKRTNTRSTACPDRRANKSLRNIINHGVGQFGGLVRTEVNGKIQEAVKLIYRNNDILFVSIHALHKLSKYKGKDGEAPALNKLGSGAWEKMKDRTKKKVKDIARDLITYHSYLNNN